MLKKNFICIYLKPWINTHVFVKKKKKKKKKKKILKVNLYTWYTPARKINLIEELPTNYRTIHN